MILAALINREQDGNESRSRNTKLILIKEKNESPSNLDLLTQKQSI